MNYLPRSTLGRSSCCLFPLDQCESPILIIRFDSISAMRCRPLPAQRPPSPSPAQQGSAGASAVHAVQSQTAHQQHQPQKSSKKIMPPQRTTKTAQKLVIFPSSGQPASQSDPDHSSILMSPVMWTPGDATTTMLSQGVTQLTAKAAQLPIEDRARTEAERTPKDRRFGLPRVTCFCAAQAYDLKAITRYLVDRHRVQPELYDECLYVSYEHGGIRRGRQGSLKISR
jgi:hypothetical protein